MALFRIVQITNNGLPPLYAIFDRSNRPAPGSRDYHDRDTAIRALKAIRALHARKMKG